MKNIVIIPARLQSQRLPNKLLMKIHNRYLFQIVYENISNSKLLDDVLIATDSNEIINICKSLNYKFIETPDYFQSGTDRIYWAMQQLEDKYDLIINVQADEPMLMGDDLDAFIDFISKKDFDVATIVTKIKTIEDITNPNTVKVVMDNQNRAMYFSRAPIPYPRDGFNSINLNEQNYFKHIGIYAYKPEILNKFAELPQSNYEKIEKLEQLRLLSMGYRYLCYEICKDLISVDTIEDYEKVLHMIV